MDLCEVKKNFNRHPWELARVRALEKILRLRENSESDLRILDVGCGDGFIVNNVLQGSTIERIDGVDINLRNSDIKKLSSLYNNITFHNTFETLRAGKYNLILLLDVLEHIEDDVSFLIEITEKYMDFGGYCLVAAPAFNCLFSSHDRFLRHYRRYNLKELMRVINSVRLLPKSYGYLFFSLIPIRLISIWYERLAKIESMANKGVGTWKHSKITTDIVTFFLTMDNCFSITLGNLGFNLPGLTVWALCKKQPS